MIKQAMEKWHQFVNGQSPNILDELLDDDVVFYSPIVFKAQNGKAITKMYLHAAAATFGAGGDPSKPGIQNFSYCKEVYSTHQAILEFETEVGGVYVNGVDIITCNDEGLITEFKVMVRPLQAVNALHQQMKKMLAAG